MIKGLLLLSFQLKICLIAFINYFTNILKLIIFPSDKIDTKQVLSGIMWSLLEVWISFIPYKGNK